MMIYQKLKDLLEIPNPCLLQKNWYSRPTPPDMQFEERVFQTQFSISADKLYEWNIDGLSEQEIINKMSHMSMGGIAYQNNHDLDQPDIVNYLLLIFLVLFVDGGIHISQTNPEILLNTLLKRMMKVCLFLMKILVAVF